jgi:hypothetical protein
MATTSPNNCAVVRIWTSSWVGWQGSWATKRVLFYLLSLHWWLPLQWEPMTPPHIPSCHGSYHRSGSFVSIKILLFIIWLQRGWLIPRVLWSRTRPNIREVCSTMNSCMLQMVGLQSMILGYKCMNGRPLCCLSMLLAGTIYPKRLHACKSTYVGALCCSRPK